MNIGKSEKQLTRNILSLTLVQIANYGMPLISVPIISRIIGPEKFGIINFSAAFVTYFTLLISYGFDLTATRKIAKDPYNEDNRSTVFSEVFCTQLLLLLLATCIFLILVFTVPRLQIDRKIITFSFILCISTVFTQNWLFQAMQDLSRVALFNLVSKVLFTMTILLLIKRSDDYIWQPLLIGIIQTFVSLTSFLWAIKVYKIKLTRVPLARCLQLLWEEKTVFFSLVVVNLYTTTNTFILGLYQSAEQTGFYTAGQRLILIAQSILTLPLTQAFYPFIGKAFRDDRQQGLRVTQKILPLIIIFTGVATIVMILLGPLVIRSFYGHKFEAAVPVFQILAMIPLCIAVSNVFGIQIMLNLGLDRFFLRITSVGALLSILLNVFMIRQWGYIGTSFNWLLTEVFILISMYVVLLRQGINPVELHYFKFSSLKEYLGPIKTKLFTR
ncbi:flippase [Dyadobacter psychrophilus]|uniref:Polysaccharide transporter, PST family n=1 Tax=Dyadobacter psychrophilus TaxID=651661 RepID=A0A1T5HE67_9BACT|nr:flippase [Dyadobacter psychrophilus]SKC18962.1 polysaccharide transporter, PST family [Dyadobacter psychrophilus]